jgi:3-deoxy-D-manno-octulosonate 8-phosphate phosphatase (KDO 8-P phosphatase)
MAGTPVIDAALLAKASGIRVLLLDVDGVLTDGGLYFGAEGELFKRFNTLDGHGLKMLQRAGITPAVVTGRGSAALRSRLAALGIVHARYDIDDKAPAAEEILAELGLGWGQAAVMGDDWPDLPMMLRAALVCAPANAHPEVRSRADIITRREGGAGAVREVCDLMLTASGQYPALLAAYTGGGA